MKIVIIDYGMGNIKSVAGALKYVGIDDIIVSNCINDIKAAQKLILPGVGSFANAIANIKELNLFDIIKEEVIVNKKPILGICLGMQLMASFSEEDGYTEGFNFIDAEVKKFQDTEFKIPHVGFNQIKFNSESKLLKELNDSSDFYFVHSYRMKSNEKINCFITDYSEEFISGFEKENIAGVQFHPELSQTNGLKLIENFIKNF